MNEIVSTKIKVASDGEEYLVIYERGNFLKPLAILDNKAMKDVLEEWKR